jgi:hypothetical protein
MGETRKNCPMQTISRGKKLVQISSMWMVFKKMAIMGRKYEMRNMDGRKLARRRYTTIPVEKEERCPFRMKI